MGWMRCECQAWRKVGHYDDGDGEPVAACSSCGRPEFRRREVEVGSQLCLVARSTGHYLTGTVEEHPDMPGHRRVVWKPDEDEGLWSYDEVCTPPPNQRLIRTFSGKPLLKLPVPMRGKDQLTLTWPGPDVDPDGNQAFTDLPLDHPDLQATDLQADEG